MREAVAQRDLGNGIGVEQPLQLAPYPIEPQAQAIDAWRFADETMEVLLQPAR